MGKRQIKHGGLHSLAKGALVALVIYLCGCALLAGLLVGGKVPEQATHSALVVLCGVSAFAGGMVSLHGTSLGSVPEAMLCALAVMGALVLVGSCWNGVCWNRENGLLLLSALGGGLLAGILGRRIGRKGKRRRGV